MHLKFLFSPINVTLTPLLINDLSRMLEFFQNFIISFNLKQYRPQRRPMTTKRGGYLSDQMKRKRRLIVRDWFFYVVWYVRLKRLMLSHHLANSNSGR